MKKPVARSRPRAAPPPAVPARRVEATEVAKLQAIIKEARELGERLGALIHQAEQRLPYVPNQAPAPFQRVDARSAMRKSRTIPPQK